MTVRKNQEGLGLIIVPIIILIALMIGVGSYYVYSKDKDDSAVVVEEAPAKDTKPAEATKEAPKNITAYTDECSQLTLNVPKTWLATEGGGVSYDEARCGAFYMTTSTGNTLYWTASFYGDGPGLCFDDTTDCAKVSVIEYEKLPSSAGLLTGMYAVKTKSCYTSVDSCLGAVFLLSSEIDPASLKDVASLSVVNEIPKGLVKGGQTVQDSENANRSWVAISMMQHKGGNVAGSGEVQVSTKTVEDYEGAIVFTSAETDTWLNSEDANAAFNVIKSAKL